MVHQLKIGQCSARYDLAAVTTLVITDVDATMALKRGDHFIFNVSEDILIAFDNDDVLCLKTRTQQYFVSVHLNMISP